MDVRPEETLQVRLRCFGELEVLRRRLEVRFGRAPDRETSTLAEIVRRGATPPLTPFLPF